MPYMLWSNTRKILPPNLRYGFPQVLIHPEHCDVKILAWHTLRQHLFFYTQFFLSFNMIRNEFFAMKYFSQSDKIWKMFELNFADVKHRPLMQIVKHVKWSTFSLNIYRQPLPFLLIEVEWHIYVSACWSVIGSSCGLSLIRRHFVVGANCGLLTKQNPKRKLLFLVQARPEIWLKCEYIFYNP